MISRTYGWVQNPSDFSKLKLVVQIFDFKSAHYMNLRDNLIPNFIYFDDIKNNLINKLNSKVTEFSYLELVGTSKNKMGKSPKTRADAVADSLIQITVLPQNYKTKGKMWTDNWTSDGFLRWALSLNFIKHDRNTDMCSITDLGREYSRAKENSNEEIEILRKAILSYPPATQVLSILENSKTPVSKFYIGNNLGFNGEKGFTSYDESLMLDWFKTGSPKEQEAIKSNIEGTSDKYARMIANWLVKIGFAENHSTKISTINGERSGFQHYSITARGSHALKQANGSSKNSRIKKFFTWEFLAVDGKNRNYVRSRRGYILKILKDTTSFNVLIEKLKNLGFNDEIEIIENDINGLNNFGIRIERNNSSVILKDDFLPFSIPDLNLTQELKDKYSDALKAKYIKLTGLPMKYIELLDIAFDGKRNRDFEIITADLFKNIYGLESVLLGGGRKPDGIIFTDKFGVIVDTKAYGNGYSKEIKQEDEMVRYIEDNQLRDKERNPVEWWNNFNPSIPSNSFYFMWISSKFIGKFTEQLESTYNRTGVHGGALNVEQLLLGAHKVQIGELDVHHLPDYIQNKEIFW
ncbi:restriction endonuclease FokI C-terminal domain-containing protein [Streptococcus anginosus]|uniref:restriction endonuclease FokI C-terminal domain-containing protein n=1 Tax=Streptococcus anginosus TaxID=1328 RepID=UPI001245B99A|nr:restriction endonuclease FokI C-terminal domain-containing protein [Streptococcus anginosus]KAA9246572.1 restriction endonuclease [Streptococcus anginosus]MED5833149.1 restriction endonuclease FokI C-terminal domain-containing protein [Streptococcus anginosus]MED5835103.1 restriction endonuclease FokI C-terminal domain-containing protein [Streptococcus anginosus]